MACSCWRGDSDSAYCEGYADTVTADEQDAAALQQQPAAENEGYSVLHSVSVIFWDILYWCWNVLITRVSQLWWYILGGSSQRQSGKITLKDFKVLKRLGNGSFGVVVLVQPANGYLGRDRDDLLAIKGVARQKIQRGTVRERANNAERKILQELRRINAPFCLQLVCTFNTEISFYFVTEFYSGGTLQHFIQSQQKLDVDHFTILAAELIYAMGFLHERGILHRDIKANNIAIDAQGHVAVIDFGSAHFKADQVLAQRFAGTTMYLAPEALRKNVFNEMTDWWAVGVTLFWALTKRIPFARIPLKKFRITRLICRRTHAQIKSYVRRNNLPNIVGQFLLGLVEYRPDQRLGSSFRKLKRHKFFRPLLKKSSDWEKLANRQLFPPFNPADFGLWSPHHKPQPSERH